MTDQIYARRSHAKRLGAALIQDGDDPAFVKTVRDRHELTEEILRHGRERRHAMASQQKLDRSLESFVRSFYTDWRVTAPDAERKKENKKAIRLIKDAKKAISRHRCECCDQTVLVSLRNDRLAEMVRANEESRAKWDKIRNDAERAMIKLAARLPAANWTKPIRGAGLKGLAIIIAETGTLDGYANPAKLWKRLGFAPYQGFALSTYRRPKWRPRALTAEEQTSKPGQPAAAAFNAERYAHMFTLAKPLRDHQWIGAKKAGAEDGKGRPKPGARYGQLYAERRAKMKIKHPDWTNAHFDKDGLRVMFKRFLADLWEAWMDATYPRVTGEAAADQGPIDTHPRGVGGGTVSANHRVSEVPAVGQHHHAARRMSANGGSNSTKRGQRKPAAPPPTSQSLLPNQRMSAADPSKKPALKKGRAVAARQKDRVVHHSPARGGNGKRPHA